MQSAVEEFDSNSPPLRAIVQEINDFNSHKELSKCRYYMFALSLFPGRSPAEWKISAFIYPLSPLKILSFHVSVASSGAGESIQSKAREGIAGK
jgi:hypothetical protein